MLLFKSFYCTVNLKMYELKTFHKKRFCVKKKKIHSYGWAKFLTRWLKGGVI